MNGTKNQQIMQILDVILLVMLAMGNFLAVPIWYWLFGNPLMRLLRAMERRIADWLQAQAPSTMTAIF
jgi:hypothetical protein